MANDFDRIFKDTLGHIFLFLSEKYFGFEADSWQQLKPAISGTYEREVDYLYEVVTPAGEVFLLHIEFQPRDDPRMLSRMQVYHALLYDLYQKPIRHKVIYLGQRPSRMKHRLPKSLLFTGFDLISLSEQSFMEMLHSEHPWEVVLAVLSDFGDFSVDAGLTQILDRLREMELNDTEFKRSLAQLKILSRLRKLDSKATATINKMPINFDFDVEEDAFYQLGRKSGDEEGFQRGRKVGKEKGIKEGEKRERFKSAARFVQRGTPIEEAAEVQGLDVEELKDYIRQAKT